MAQTDPLQRPAGERIPLRTGKGKRETGYGKRDTGYDQRERGSSMRRPVRLVERVNNMIRHDRPEQCRAPFRLGCIVHMDTLYHVNDYGCDSLSGCNDLMSCGGGCETNLSVCQSLVTFSATLNSCLVRNCNLNNGGSQGLRCSTSSGSLWATFPWWKNCSGSWRSSKQELRQQELRQQELVE